MTKVRYCKEELRSLALWLCSTYGKEVVVNNGLIKEAQVAMLPRERHKPINYQLISPLTKLVQDLDADDLETFESTRSIIANGVMDQRNGTVTFQPDQQQAVVMAPLAAPLAPRAKGEVRIQALITPPVALPSGEAPVDLLETLVSLNLLILKLYETPLSVLARASELDRKRLHNLCVQATNGLSNFEEFL